MTTLLWSRAPQHGWLIAEQGASGEEGWLSDDHEVVAGLGDGAADLAICCAHDRQEEERAEDDP